MFTPSDDEVWHICERFGTAEEFILLTLGKLGWLDYHFIPIYLDFPGAGEHSNTFSPLYIELNLMLKLPHFPPKGFPIYCEDFRQLSTVQCSKLKSFPIYCEDFRQLSTVQYSKLKSFPIYCEDFRQLSTVQYSKLKSFPRKKCLDCTPLYYYIFPPLLERMYEWERLTFEWVFIDEVEWK